HVALLTTDMPGGVLGSRVKDYRLRITVQSAQSAVAGATAKIPFGLSVGSSPAQGLGTLAVGQSSDWVNLDVSLKDQQGPFVTQITAPGNINELKLQVDVAHGDPANGGKLLKSMTDEVLGNNVIVLLPGYGYDPPDQRDAAIELLSDHAEKYLAAAQAVAVPANERPRLFNISTYQMLGGQGSVEQLQREAKTLSLLGFNTTNAYWWGAIPPSQVNEVLNANGLKGRTSASYAPPSYFAFDTALMNPQALAKWAAAFPEGAAKTNGAAPADVVTHYLADEPGWYYPTMTDQVSKNAQYLAAFRAYLQKQGLKPADVGQENWDGVFPIGASQGAKADASLEERRLFYWTMRFFPDSAAQGFRMASEAIEKAYGHPIDTTVNWNNWFDSWYSPSPNLKIGNNPISNPDSAMGAPDWFTTGRLSANTLWTEDWFGDSNAQAWSLYSDALRSASMLGDSRFGGYVVGPSLGAFPSGAKYKILDLLGHGAKSLDIYTFGPELLFPGNCWSEGFSRYGPIASALGLVGRSERLLYPGKPARGKVAIMVPSASRLWESGQAGTYYQAELTGLDYALVDDNYTVDFVDGTDLSIDDWMKRGYTTLYITAPNVTAAAQQKIAAWVRAGGTLVTTPGAGVADEYNTPTTLFDEILGVKTRQAERTPATRNVTVTDHLIPKDNRFATDTLELSGAVNALQPTSASALAMLQSGGAAITANVFSKGRGIAYAFFPGWQYEHSADYSNPLSLPQGWSVADLKLVTAPAQIAHTPRPVITDQKGVETVLLQSSKGIAVTLLNWTAKPINNLSVTIADPGKFRKVTSADGVAVKSTFVNGQLKVLLPLKDVDVLMIE
ncbi:MAG: beta-galactosidase trimerization domain-containing protein, partial [Abditibacteriaceae bacterium]